MGLNLFCKHERYDVISWRYCNIGKYNQYIEASIICKQCGKQVTKEIKGDKCKAFETAYEEQYGR